MGSGVDMGLGWAVELVHGVDMVQGWGVKMVHVVCCRHGAGGV